jgi:arylsulfatase A-like enzyme
MRRAAASVIDVAPTVLAHLDLPCDGLDGRALQQPDTARTKEEARWQASR